MPPAHPLLLRHSGLPLARSRGQGPVQLGAEAQEASSQRWKGLRQQRRQGRRQRPAEGRRRARQGLHGDRGAGWLGCEHCQRSQGLRHHQATSAWRRPPQRGGGGTAADSCSTTDGGAVALCSSAWYYAIVWCSSFDVRAREAGVQASVHPCAVSCSAADGLPDLRSFQRAVSSSAAVRGEHKRGRADGGRPFRPARRSLVVCAAPHGHQRSKKHRRKQAAIAAALPPPLAACSLHLPSNPPTAACRAPCSSAPAAATRLWVSAEHQSCCREAVAAQLPRLAAHNPSCLPAGHLSHSPHGFSALHRPDVTFSCGGLLYPVHSMLLAGAWEGWGGGLSGQCLPASAAAPCAVSPAADQHPVHPCPPAVSSRFFTEFFTYIKVPGWLA